MPVDLNAEYYGQRASAGLIISEATSVSPRGFGYADTPGIFSDDQVSGWRKATNAVHDRGGRIFLQLWHVGRISHPTFQPGGDLPVAPSAIRPRGQVFTASGPVEYVEPRALEESEIPALVGEFAKGASHAMKAGFDGVEIHNANGYLLDQFLRDGTNRRTDSYGGTIKKRARLMLEVTEAVVAICGSGRVGIRFSPGGTFNDMHDSNPLETFGYALRELDHFGLAYAHISRVTTSDADHGAQAIGPRELREHFTGNVVSAGGFTLESGNQALSEGWADAIAFGELFLANPDLPERLRLGAPLNRPVEATFYSKGPEGYTDYPQLP